MKKIILLLLAFFCLTNTNAQTNAKVTDSLKVLLQKEKQDTSRVRLLTELSFRYRNSKLDTAMVLALEALALSKRIRFVKGEIAALNGIGNVYRIIGNTPKAMEAYLQVLKLNEKYDNLEGIETNLGNIGLLYLQHGEYKKAIDYLLKVKKSTEHSSRKERHGLNLARIGRGYLGLKQYDTASFYAQQSYELARKTNYGYLKGVSFSLMGSIYSETGQKKIALEYYRQSIPYIKRNEVWGTLAGTYFNMAKLFETEGQLDSSLFYANQAFQINTGIGKFTKGVSDASTFLSSFYKRTGNIDSAFSYIEIAKAANDSLFSQKNISQLQSLEFDEKIRQQEIALAELNGKEERKHNLQFVAIAIGLITFIILFFVLSRSIIVKTKFIEFFGVLLLLAVFEFINLFIHPYLDKATNHSPVLMLLILIIIGAGLVPLHHKLEKWMTHVMVEKNKKIRLDAAEKTIVELTVKQAN